MNLFSQHEKMLSEVNAVHQKSLEEGAKQEREMEAKMKKLQAFRMGNFKKEDEERERQSAAVALGQEKLRDEPVARRAAPT